ncbi:MAG: PPOX class F420-dependent oxidoreductase [Thaumarchaeota archaeon]|nr:PPOX class F420-dependent oxidoreductase [Nitrososphaerota archaeon]
MPSDKLGQFRNTKCINLETYRKDGRAVQTPVWYVIDDDVIYVSTPATTGKIKRLTANKHVRIVPCNFRGDPKGDWVEATAYFANKSESEKAIVLRKKKYGLMAKLIQIIVYKKGASVVFGIKI